MRPNHTRVLLLGLALLTTTAAPALADEPQPNAPPQAGTTRLAEPTGPRVSQLDGIAVWSQYSDGAYNLVVARDGGQPVVSPVKAQPDPFDVDLGLSAGGGAVDAVMSRCRFNGGGRQIAGSCDLHRVDLDTGRETAIPSAAQPGVDEILPAVWKGKVLFAARRRTRTVVEQASVKGGEVLALALGINAATDVVNDTELGDAGVVVSFGSFSPDPVGSQELRFKPRRGPVRTLAQWGYGEAHIPSFSPSLVGQTLWVAAANLSGSPGSDAIVTYDLRTDRLTPQASVKGLDAVAADAADPSAPALFTTDLRSDSLEPAYQVARLDVPRRTRLSPELRRVLDRR